MGKVIGIDLGTTNSCVSVLEASKPVVITNAEGSRTTPSIIGFDKNNLRLVGQLAKRQSVTNAENTIYSIKRFIGRRWEDTEQERSRVSYHCVPGKDNTVDVSVRENVYTPQEISAMVLQKLKADAEAFLGEEVRQAVITVPAYFTDAQRQATKDAGTIAGLEVLRIINEPTAAALAYGLDKQDQEQFILVFDLGGGTFDVSILQLGDSVLEVKATSGNNQLGGDDFDNVLLEWMVETFDQQEGINLNSDKMALQRLREAAEKAKIELSSTIKTSINLPFLTADGSVPKHFEIDLTRQEFEFLAQDYINQTLRPVEQALKDSELTAKDIDRIILVGGSTRIPAVQGAIQNFFPGTPIDRSVNPDEAIAVGAAIQAGVLNGEVKELLLLDVAPISLGIETVGEVFTKIIERNTTLPTSNFRVFSTVTDSQPSVEIHVLQGERALAKDNKSLGRFLLTGIPPAPRGLPQIEVSFEIDVNGILQVSARDRGTDKAHSIRITNTGSLSMTEIEAMRADAAQYAEEDQQRLQTIALQNEAEALFNSLDITLRENIALLSTEVQSQLIQKRAILKQSFSDQSYSVGDIRSLLEDFRDTLLSIGTRLYNSEDRSVPSPSSVMSAVPVSPSNSSEEQETQINVVIENGEGNITNDYESID